MLIIHKTKSFLKIFLKTKEKTFTCNIFKPVYRSMITNHLSLRINDIVIDFDTVFIIPFSFWFQTIGLFMDIKKNDHFLFVKFVKTKTLYLLLIEFLSLSKYYSFGKLSSLFEIVQWYLMAQSINLNLFRYQQLC